MNHNQIRAFSAGASAALLNDDPGSYANCPAYHAYFDAAKAGTMTFSTESSVAFMKGWNGANIT